MMDVLDVITLFAMGFVVGMVLAYLGRERRTRREREGSR